MERGTLPPVKHNIISVQEAKCVHVVLYIVHVHRSKAI